MRVRIIRSHCLGGGRDVYEGQLVDIADDADSKWKLREGWIAPAPLTAADMAAEAKAAEDAAAAQAAADAKAAEDAAAAQAAADAKAAEDAAAAQAAADAKAAEDAAAAAKSAQKPVRK